MSETFDPYTLLFLVLAIAVFLKLRNVLGRRTGNERNPFDPYSAGKSRNDAARAQRQDKIVAMPRNHDAARAMKPTAEDIEKRLRKFAPKGSALSKALKEMVKIEPTFDPEIFLSGAKAAYEMIVMAFAEGNKKILKQLLNADVYTGFETALDERKTRSEAVESSFVGISKADIIEAGLKKKLAQVTVKFVSELITSTRDQESRVIDGDPNTVREVIDIWTFARELSSHDPNWKLVATEAAN